MNNWGNSSAMSSVRRVVRDGVFAVALGWLAAATAWALPDLSVSNLVVGSIVTRQDGGWNIPVTYTVTNVGTTTAPPYWHNMGYLSADGVLDNGDLPGVSGHWFFSYGPELAVGASFAATGTFIVYSYVNPGNYTMFVKADGRSAVYHGGGATNTDSGGLAESDETNNTASAPVQLARPDLSVSNLVVGTVAVGQDGNWTIPVSFTVTNTGAVAASPSWLDMAYLSADGVLDNADQPSYGYWYLGGRGTTLAPGESYVVNGTFAAPATTPPGTYRLIAKADGQSAVYHGGGASNTDSGVLFEMSEANNTIASEPIQFSRPDLSVSDLVVGAVTVAQNGSWTMPVSFTVTNTGAATAAPSWLDMAYLSVDGVLDNGDQPSHGWWYLGGRGTPLAPGESYAVNGTFSAPASTPLGTYRLIAKADGRSTVYHGSGASNTDAGTLVETNEANNTIASAPVQLLRPDLSVSNVVLGAAAVRQEGGWNIPVSFTVTNTGTATAAPSWLDMAYLSADGVLDNADQPSHGYWYLGSRGTPLAPGQSYSVNGTFATPASTAPGTYTLFVKADGHSAAWHGISATNTDAGDLVEIDESNNVLASSQIQLDRPNLAVSSLTRGTIVNRPDGVWVIPVSYKVTNVGAAPAVASWYDMGYLSVDGVLSNNDESNGYLALRSSTLAPGASYDVSSTYFVPASVAPGSYTLLVKADAHNSHSGGSNYVGPGAVAETNEEDNVAALVVQLNIQSDTTTGLTSSVNPAIVAQGTTLTATVTPASATGTVTFKDGATVLGTSTINSGVATLAASFGYPGAHSLTATYSSDPYLRASTSPAYVQTVNKAPTVTTLSALPGTAARGEPVQLIVSVSGADPSGTLLFKDGSTVIGTHSVSNGSAILGLSFPVARVYNLKVEYPGDSNNEASSSQVVSLTVTEGGGGTAPGALTWLYGYDANGNQLYVIDPNGNRTDRTFNLLDNVATVIQPAPTSGAARPVIGYGYDGLGQVTSVTDPRNLATSYSVDGLGNTLATASPDTGTAGATYDAAGNVLTRSDARGKTTTYTYDVLNRVTSISYANGVPTVFEYDGGATPLPTSIGKLTRITDESGSTSYTYDAHGNVTSKTHVAGSRTLVVGYEWGTSGSTNGKLTAVRYPSGAQVNYLYGTNGAVTAITVNPVNASGSGTNTGASLGVLSNLAYTGANQPKSWTWASGSAYLRTYDSFGRLVSYPLGNPAGSGASAGVLRTLGYDDAARIMGYTHTGAGSLDQSFVYDGLDRLANAIQAGTFHGYGYDATGNRTQRTVGAQTYALGISPTSNRLTSVQDSTGTASIVHDAAGNIVSDGLGTYTYSDRGRMSAATLAGGTVQYRYNGLEQRVSKTGPVGLVPTGASYYAYDEAGHVIGEYDADGVPRYETVYLGDTPVAAITQARSGSPVTVQTNIAFVYADHIDTPRVIARSGDEAIVWRWDLAEAFGATPANDNPSGLGSYTFNQRFPGQVLDAETGLHYNWHRDYSPGTGRYVQSDPIGLMGGINTFGYALADPVARIDPNGLQVVIVIPGRRRSVDPDFPPGVGPNHQSDSALQDLIERGANRSQYKNRCEEKPPEDLRKPITRAEHCKLAKWNRDKWKDCKALREENTKKWWGGVDSRHSAQLMKDIETNISDAERAVKQFCRSDCE